MLPSELGILPASQNDYPEASHHNNGDGVSLPCHSGSDASESLVLNGTIVGTPEGSSTASPVDGLTPNDTSLAWPDCFFPFVLGRGKKGLVTLP